MPRSASMVNNPQTFVPERFFQSSARHVSWPVSPGRGTEWKVQTSFPVCTSHARVSPAAPMLGPSCTCAPVITTFLKTIGGDERPNDEFASPLRAPGFMSTTPSLPNPGIGLPVLAFRAYSLPVDVPKKMVAG